MLMRRVCLRERTVVMWSACDVEDGGGVWFSEVVDCVRVLVVAL